jgi:hypothetical protein
MSQTDQLTDAGETFFFREGIWTSRTGMCVSMERSAALTQKFFAHHGRSPAIQLAIRERPMRQADRNKTALVRAAVARALARRAATE